MLNPLTHLIAPRAGRRRTDTGPRTRRGRRSGGAIAALASVALVAACGTSSTSAGGSTSMATNSADSPTTSTASAAQESGSADDRTSISTRVRQSSTGASPADILAANADTSQAAQAADDSDNAGVYDASAQSTTTITASGDSVDVAGGAADDVAVDIRLDITLDAAEPGVRITAATAHLLGSLTWVEGEDRALLLASSRASACHCAIVGEDPLERVREIAAGPGGRLGVITCERVMLHCVSGVSSHDIEEILDIDSADAAAAPSASWSPQAIMDAHEAVSAVGQLGLRAVCEAVREGQMPGWICSSRPAVGVCPTLWDRTLCVDVDAHGVTLMSITGEEVTTLVVSFGQALADACEVGPALEKLASHALPQRLTRP